MKVLKPLNVVVICLSMLVFLPNKVNAQTDINSAYSLFLYNFAKYSQWPAGKTGDFVITVLGETKVYDEIKKISASKSINGRKIVVNKVRDVSAIGDSDLLFIAKSHSSSIGKIKESTTGQPMLVVGEQPGLFKKGACISFHVDGQSKLKFQINDQELNSRNLKMAQSLKNMAFKG